MTSGGAERRLLAVMPLHPITSVHGEAGLRERLLLEVASFPAADRARAGDALALASRLHAGDARQREPYASHLLRVAIRILSHYRVADPDVACAGLLHDCVEDHAADMTSAGTRRLPSPRWPAGSADGPPPWWPRSPTRCTSPGGMSTSSTASMSRGAWRRARGRG